MTHDDTDRVLRVRARLHRDAFDLDVELEAGPSSTVALLGPNGAGKSTLFELVAGIDDPPDRRRGDAPPVIDELRVSVGGRVLTDWSGGIRVPSSERSTGVVFQDHLLFDHLDVVDNVAFGPRSAGRSRTAAREIATDWIDRLGLGDLAHRRPRELSGGQAQRVAIARTLAADPDVLLLDEPLAALDVTARTELRRVLVEHLGRFDGPRLIVTHEPADAFVMADEVVVLEAGRITQRGTPDEIRRHPTTPYVAAIGGTNLLRGDARDGRVTLDDHELALTIADSGADGPVVVTIHPRAISLHPDRPRGSQRNVWSATVDLVEPLGDTVRVSLAGPLRVSADITPSAVETLGIADGATVWAAVKATEIAVSPA